MKRLYGVLCFVVVVTLTNITWAGDATIVTLSATEEITVGEDVLVASLRVEKEAKTATEVQEAINQKMVTAIALVKEMPSLKVKTEHYYVYPDYRGDKRQEIDKWRGAQTLVFESSQADDVIKMAGKLQAMGFVMNTLDYKLAPETYAKMRDGLIEKAIASLKQRAERVAKALGKKQAELVEINVSDQSPLPMQMRSYGMMEMRVASADASMTTPSAEPGETQVSLTINAKAVVK